MTGWSMLRFKRPFFFQLIIGQANMYVLHDAKHSAAETKNCLKLMQSASTRKICGSAIDHLWKKSWYAQSVAYTKSPIKVFAEVLSWCIHFPLIDWLIIRILRRLISIPSAPIFLPPILGRVLRGSIIHLFKRTMIYFNMMIFDVENSGKNA